VRLAPPGLQFLFATWLLLSGAVWAAPAEGRYSADEVKAAFLYNFTGFVTWPPEARAGEGIVIGVMGAEEVEAELRRSAAARPGRAVTVRRVVSVDDAFGAHILFVGARENARLGNLLPALRQAPILTVTEAPDGIDRGSMINFVTADRVQFEISVEAAARSGLHLSSRLLSVATRVKKGASPLEPTIAGIEPFDAWPRTRQDRETDARNSFTANRSYQTSG
jgi:hypothetical protein